MVSDITAAAAAAAAAAALESSSSGYVVVGSARELKKIPSAWMGQVDNKIAHSGRGCRLYEYLQYRAPLLRRALAFFAGSGNRLLFHAVCCKIATIDHRVIS